MTEPTETTYMKRYLLFTGYYPRGGWNDLAGQFDTIDEVLAADRKDWAHVVDTRSGAVILTQGTDDPRLVAVRSTVQRINRLEPVMESLTDEQLRAKTAELKDRLAGKSRSVSNG